MDDTMLGFTFVSTGNGMGRSVQQTFIELANWVLGFFNSWIHFP